MRSELERVDAELQLAEEAISSIKATRSTILSSMRDHANALRPILSIPDDVLRLIFESAVTTFSFSGTIGWRKTPPWTLSLTCSRWRALAISHSLLWCTITMPAGLHTGLKILDLHLQRSAEHECDIDIRYRHRASAEKFGTVLAPHLKHTSRRWHSLSIHGILLGSMDGWSFESLTRLHLSFRSSVRFDPNLTIFRNAPRLTHLSVEDLSEGFNLDIPWERLTFYESRFSHLSALSRLVSVETLVLRDIYPHTSLSTSHVLKTIAPICLPSLHSLSLSILSDDKIVQNLSDSLVVPALRRLRVQVDISSDDTQICPDIHILEHLTHLSIIVHYDVPLLDFLRDAGRVSVLHLGDRALNLTVLSALQSVDVMPFLEYIHVDAHCLHLLPAILMVLEERHCKLRIIGRRPHCEWLANIHGDKWWTLCQQGMITTTIIDQEFEF